LRKNSLVHWAKPLEDTILVGVSEIASAWAVRLSWSSQMQISSKLEVILETGIHASKAAKKRFSAAC
jgi:hypothetical protein